MRAQKNYQKMLEATIAGLKEQNRVPTLLLHSCCAPCSSYCLEYLSQYFHITRWIIYNPQYLSGRRVSYAGAGAAAADSGTSGKIIRSHSGRGAYG